MEDDTSDTIWRNHTFHGYSPSGKVYNAPYVYANYGRPQDFDKLTNAGINVNNTIVIVRYGQCFRGLKVKNAQLRGAVGVIIYSDPYDDGYIVGDIYPNGPWRPSYGIQRGSVQFNSICGGDPYRIDTRYVTKFNQTLKDICGVNSHLELIPSIPSIPMSYGDITPILHNIGGPLAIDVGGDDFVGGIYNLTYRVGIGSNSAETETENDDNAAASSASVAVLDMIIENEESSIQSIPNVIGIIPGSLPPERDMPVLLGNHRDAW